MRLVATWTVSGAKHRLVRIAGDGYNVERRHHDAPGLELWTTIHYTKGPALRDGGAHARIVQILIAGIEALVGERIALARTYDYSTGEGVGPLEE